MKKPDAIFTNGTWYWAVWKDGGSIAILSGGHWSKRGPYHHATPAKYAKEFPAERRLTPAEMSALLRKHPLPGTAKPKRRGITDTDRLNWLIKNTKMFIPQDTYGEDSFLASRSEIDREIRHDRRARREGGR